MPSTAVYPGVGVTADANIAAAIAEAMAADTKNGGVTVVAGGVE